MDGEPFVISTLVNRECYACTLIDTRCLSYGLMTSHFVRKNGLKRIKIRPVTMEGFDGSGQASIRYVAVACTNIRGHEEVAYFYIADWLLDSYDLILGLPWFRRNSVQLCADKETLRVGREKVVVRNEVRTIGEHKDYRLVLVVSFLASIQVTKGNQSQVFAVSLQDINKALALKKTIDPCTKLPRHYREFLPLFSMKELDKLLLL
jgi:hypothetical protein